MAALVTGLTAGAARGAGWPTNAYPPWQHVRQSRTWADCTYSAAMERATVRGVSGPAAPAWWSGLYRDSRPDLIKYKTWLRGACTGFIDAVALGNVTNYLNSTAGWATNTPAAGLLPRHTVTGMLVQCGLPTNWFDYTPFRDLSGLGVFTNATDYTATGRAYGHTNTQTAAGGTVPTNRTAWRTTDYGWAGVTAIVGRLTRTEMGGAPFVTNFQVLVIGQGISTSSWADALLGETVSLPGLASEVWYSKTGTEPCNHFPWAFTRGEYFIDSWYTWNTKDEARAEQPAGDAWYTNALLALTIPRSVQLYLPLFRYTNSAADSIITEYDACGTPYAEGWNLMTSSGSSTSHVTYALAAGSNYWAHGDATGIGVGTNAGMVVQYPIADHTDVPACADPQTAGSGTDRWAAKGWQGFRSARAAYKWWLYPSDATILATWDFEYE